MLKLDDLRSSSSFCKHSFLLIIKLSTDRYTCLRYRNERRKINVPYDAMKIKKKKELTGHKKKNERIC